MASQASELKGSATATCTTPGRAAGRRRAPKCRGRATRGAGRRRRYRAVVDGVRLRGGDKAVPGAGASEPGRVGHRLGGPPRPSCRPCPREPPAALRSRRERFPPTPISYESSADLELGLLQGYQTHEAALHPARLEGREHEGHAACTVLDRRAQVLGSGAITGGLQDIGDLGVEVAEGLQVSLG